MPRLYAVIVALTLLVGGCGDDGPSVTGHGRLRPDIIEVLPPADIQRVVSDVDVEGDRIAVVSIRDIQYVSFTISDDRGQTWTSYLLDLALGTDILWDANQVGVHLQGGKTFLLMTRGFSPRTTEWALYEVTLVPASATLPPLMELTEITPSSILHPFSFSERRPNGNLRGMVTLGNEAPIVYELNAVTGEVSYDEPACTGRACNGDWWVSGDGGDTFHGYSHDYPGVDMCRLRWHETEPTRQACVPEAAWFVPQYSHGNHVLVSGDQPYLAWSQDGEAYALGITDAGTLTPVLPLGPGKIEHFALSRLGRTRFAEFERIAPIETLSDEGRLVRITADGPEQVQFRETPCAEVGCGYNGAPNFGLSLVQWIEPTGRGDYYVFYTVQSTSLGTMQALYMSPSETPTFSPIEPSGPLPGPATIAPPADAAPMTALQAACALWTSCTSNEPGPTFAGCMRHWSTTLPEAPYLAVGRARFLAAATGGCSAIYAAWPEGFPAAAACTAQCLATGGSCASGSTTCSNVVTTGSCGTCSDAATYLDCTFTDMHAVTCPAGTACSAGVGCVVTPTCGQTSCAGTDLTVCDPGTSAVTTHDCAGRGGTCDLATESCVTAQASATCTPGIYLPTCEGPYLTACGLGTVVYTDCRALGFATCVPVTGGGRCM